MSLTNKALFIIERNLTRDLSLGWIAKQCDVSPFHLVRAFSATTGISLMSYVRGRRLTCAADALARGAPDILQLALEHNYASHEAFSRAFKARFDTTPDNVRRSGDISGLALVEALSHRKGKAMTLKEPRIETLGALKFVGLKRHVSFQTPQSIAGQWQEFMSRHYGAIAHRIGEPPVGVTTAADDDGIDYVCAAGVDSFGTLPDGCVEISVAPATYAVFAHDGHVTEMPETYDSIWNAWFPKCRWRPAEAPCFERHGPAFDRQTGNGGVDIWIPVVEKAA